MRIALAVGAAALLGACSTSSAAPKNWRAIPGQRQAWSIGSGASAQEYRYQVTAFTGGLQDLASQVAIDALTRYRGARLQASTPFAPCPGAAGVANFRLADRKTLQEGFAVRNDQALRAYYFHPTGTSPDPNVWQAMQNVLCVLPA
jgi:hypothetical protein